MVGLRKVGGCKTGALFGNGKLTVTNEQLWGSDKMNLLLMVLNLLLGRGGVREWIGLFCVLEAKNFCLHESGIPGEAGGGVNHLFPGCEGNRGPLGDILFMDELAVAVAAQMRSWGPSEGEGMRFWSPV
jgi:hypothetical protein